MPTPNTSEAEAPSTPTNGNKKPSVKTPNVGPPMIPLIDRAASRIPPGKILKHGYSELLPDTASDMLSPYSDR